MLSALSVGLYAIWTDAFRTKWDLYWARLETWEAERRRDAFAFPRRRRRTFTVHDGEVTITMDVSLIEWNLGTTGGRLHFLKWFGVPKDMTSLADLKLLQGWLQDIQRDEFGDYNAWEERFENEVPRERWIALRREDIYVAESGHLVTMMGVLESLVEALAHHRRRRVAIWTIVGSALVAMAISLVDDLTRTA